MLFISKKIPNKKFRIKLMKNKHIDDCEKLDKKIFNSNSSRTDFNKELNKNNTEYFILIMEDKINISLTLSKVKFYILHILLKSFFSKYQTEFKIVGYIGLWYVLDEVHIVSIAVDNDYRSCGLGEFLMIGAIDSAINNSSELLTLEVRVSNHKAQKLYSKFGFKQKGVRKNYYLDDREDALIMTTESILNSNYQNLFDNIYQNQLNIYNEFS
ncbi:MAG: ribosomal-protein-alanine N-acetyltransferase [Chloroflexi bacterium]|nr:ribosomal-protein-alanine N-acetyltransferase [Chloroflexota bacterium]|tara:strand:- start:28260 stop:28898 length:639 start_codon:yes stop_codon:yes gene_type:complete